MLLLLHFLLVQPGVWPILGVIGVMGCEAGQTLDNSPISMYVVFSFTMFLDLVQVQQI